MGLLADRNRTDSSAVVESQLNARIMLRRHDNVLDVKIRAPRTWLADCFLITWLLAWMYGWFRVSQVAPIAPVTVFFSIPLLFACYVILWHLLGAEIVHATSGNGLVIQRRIWNVVVRHKYLSCISSVRPLGPRMWDIDALFWNVAGGSVVVESYGKHYRIGIQLSDQAAKALARELAAHLFGSGTDSGARDDGVAGAESLQPRP